MNNTNLNPIENELMRRNQHVDEPRNGHSAVMVDNEEQLDSEVLIEDDQERLALEDENSEGRNIIKLIAMNQTYVDLTDKLIAKVDQAISKNRQQQATIKTRLNSSQPLLSVRQRHLVPQLPVFPPYFKDSSGMVPPVNEEALQIDQICDVDPLMREEKPWRDSEKKQLSEAVKESINKQQTLSLSSKKDLFVNKLKAAGADTSTELKQTWRDEIVRINRRVFYLTNRPEQEVLAGVEDYSGVDWAKISVKDFHNTRSIAQLRMKWCNEMLYSKDPWSLEEDRKLVESTQDQIWPDWDIIARQLGTRRTAFQCFERYKYLQHLDKERRPWTEEEDKRLVSLVETLKVGDEIPWAKIACYITDRNKFACEYRYERSLNRQLKHGRWTLEEDTLLLNAINKYGPQNWKKVAECVSGRSSGQCRDRWVHVLDDKRKSQPWSWEEHQRLLYGVHLFGRNNCAKIAMLLPGRNNMDVRMRIRLLIRNRIEKEKRPDKGNVEFRHFAMNHLFCKNRRKMAIDKFNELAQQEQRPENHLTTRMGLGSFVLYPESGTQVDYSLMKEKRTQEFSQYRILGSGRWSKLQKNPNEFGTAELMAELNQLPEHMRNDAIEWLKQSDNRLIEEQEMERQCPDDLDEARKFYAEMFSPERLDQLGRQIAETLPIEKTDYDVYAKLKTRSLPKLRAKKPNSARLRVIKKRSIADPAKKKKPMIGKIDATNGMRDQSSSDEAIVVHHKFRLKDRLIEEVKNAIDGETPDVQRAYLIRSLCYQIRTFDESTIRTKIHAMKNDVVREGVEKYMKSVLDDGPDEVDDFLKANVVFHPGLWEQVKGHVGKEVGADVSSKKEPMFSFRDALRKLMPPCPATINTIDLYKRKLRLDLMKSANRLFDPVDEQLISVTRLAKSSDVLDIRLSDQIKNSVAYTELKKRMYRLYFLPMMMLRAQAKLNPIEDENAKEREALRARLYELQLAQRVDDMQPTPTSTFVAQPSGVGISVGEGSISVGEYFSLGKKKPLRNTAYAKTVIVPPEQPSTSAAAAAAPTTRQSPIALRTRKRKMMENEMINPGTITDMANMTLGALLKLNSKVRKQAAQAQQQ